MVFQNYALYPHMTVAENMGFSLRMRKERRDVIDRKVRAAAATLGLEAYLDRLPRQLSGGQRQRVAMGRSIVRAPKVFLFDEPLSNLDANLRVQMRIEIKDLHQRLRTTTVYVTHDQVEAMTLADTIVVLREGRVEQVGPPLELYDRPVSLFVAGFIGSPSMNVLQGRVEGTDLRPSGRTGAWLEPRHGSPACRRRGGNRHPPERIAFRPDGLPRRFLSSSRPAPRHTSCCVWARIAWSPCRASGYRWPQGRRSMSRLPRTRCTCSTGRPACDCPDGRARSGPGPPPCPPCLPGLPCLSTS
jgi:multiple sugar transport system ATP-binding protein